MKYAIKILKDQQKKEIENKKKAMAKDSYKGVLESEKNCEDLTRAIALLETKPSKTVLAKKEQAPDKSSSKA